MSRCIWSLADPCLVEHMSQNADMNARNWIFALHEVLSQEEFVIMVVTLWAVWKSRRKAIYKDIFESPQSTHHFIQAYMNDLRSIQQDRSIVRPREGGARPRTTQWIHPPGTMCKINVDGAVSKNQKRGTAAAICRDHTGNFLGASAILVRGVYDPPTLEALAVREALALAKDLNLQNLHIASDCKVVIEDMKEQNPAGYGAILHEITDLANGFVECNFVHEYRSSNFESHNLAKHVLKLEVGRHVWLGHPDNLSFISVNIGAV